jgi:hypothetical protein
MTMATQRSRAAAKKAGPAIVMTNGGPGDHAVAPDPIEAAVEAVSETVSAPLAPEHSAASVLAVTAAQAEPQAPPPGPSEPESGPASAQHRASRPAASAAASPPPRLASMPASPIGVGYLALARAAAEFQGEAIEMMRANTVQAVRFAESMAGLATVSALELQAEQVRRQFEIINDQAKQWTALVRKVSENAP